MKVRTFRRSDTPALINLFRATVRTVNRRDYSPEQLSAWAPDEIDAKDWTTRHARNETVVAECADAIVGFAELTPEGHIHMLFVHKDHQNKGIASTLLAEMEARARANSSTKLTTDASLTAEPFFARRGFRRIREQVVERNGQTLRNCRMEKSLTSNRGNAPQ